jgi:hypothetical protein
MALSFPNIGTAIAASRDRVSDGLPKVGLDQSEELALVHGVSSMKLVGMEFGLLWLSLNGTPEV